MPCLEDYVAFVERTLSPLLASTCGCVVQEWAIVALVVVPLAIFGFFLLLWKVFSMAADGEYPPSDSEQGVATASQDYGDAIDSLAARIDSEIQQEGMQSRQSTEQLLLDDADTTSEEVTTRKSRSSSGTKRAGSRTSSRSSSTVKRAGSRTSPRRAASRTSPRRAASRASSRTVTPKRSSSGTRRAASARKSSSRVVKETQELLSFTYSATQEDLNSPARMLRKRSSIHAPDIYSPGS